MPADFSVGVDQPTMNQAAEVVYKQLYPRVFTGSKHVAKEGLEFDVLWDVKAPPTIVLEPPTEGEQIVRDHLLDFEAPAGVAQDDLVSAYVATLENTTFQLVVSNMTMTIRGEGGEGTAPCQVTIFIQADSAEGTILYPRDEIALTATRPTPGQAKTCSMITAPPSSDVSWSPSTVTSGMSMLRSACSTTTASSCSPFARAVRT